LCACIAKHVTTDTTVMLSIEEREVLTAHCALGHFLIWDPDIFLKGRILLAVEEFFDLVLLKSCVVIHLKNRWILRDI
jgi:hypothetical protein